MTRILYLFIAALWAFSATPAFAGPLAAIVPVVIGVLKVSAVVKLALTVAASVAISMLQKQKKQRPAGIMLEQTAAGGVNPRTLIFGTYATAGSLAAPLMSHQPAPNSTPNTHLIKVVALADAPITGFARVIINGEYIPVDDDGFTGEGHVYSVRSGKYAHHVTVTVFDGSQTTADPYLVSNFSSYVRPWGANRIGKGVAYAVFRFAYNAEIFKGEPDIRLELYGMRLYDVRKDSTAGGSGSHRWNNPTTWEFTENPIVMIYNILRGITLADGSVYGGDCEADDLPLANWAAAMNVADEIVDGDIRYRAGLEFALNEEPADVIEELMKAASAQMVEIGGVYKIRCGPPSLPVMFVTDDDWIITKDAELDPFPSIHSSHNTVRATFPHPEEIWQQHDAPTFTNPDFVARDNGQELVIDLSFPACPFPIQVQRNMRAWLEDDQRLVRHSGTLSHRAFALEPLDTIAWTSAKNGYVNKWFEVGGLGVNVYTLNVAPAIREVDPDDYDWDSGMELPDPVGDGSWDLPEEQAVGDFAVAPWSIKDDDSDARRPAIRCTWNIAAAIDAMAIRIEVRLLATGEQVTSMTVANVGDGQAVISEGILPATSYEVRARYLVDRPTIWTIWWSVTTGNIKFTEKDFDFDAIVEALGPSVVIPQIMKPAKDTIIQAIKDVTHQSEVTQETFLITSKNSASIRQEATIRANEDGIIAGQITTVNARLNNAGGTGVTVEQSLIAQASEINGLSGQYTLRINNNGIISGFGLASGTGGSEFTILADRFIVVDPSNNTTTAYPFQVVGGNVYIRKALIQQITADQINVNELSAISATMGDLDIRPTMGQNGRIRVFDEANVLRVMIGRLT